MVDEEGERLLEDVEVVGGLFDVWVGEFLCQE